MLLIIELGNIFYKSVVHVYVVRVVFMNFIYHYTKLFFKKPTNSQCMNFTNLDELKCLI